jgi:hypothetical protein
MQRLRRWSEFNGICKNTYALIFANFLKIFFKKKKKKKKVVFWEFYWDLTENPNGGGTSKRIKSLIQ